MNRATRAISADRRSLSTMDGSRSRSSISVPARLRLWPSSPICTIWPMIALTSTGPVARSACAEGRAEHGLHPAQPLDHLGAVRAVPQHLAQPLVQRAPARVAVHRVAQHPTPTSTARPRPPSGPRRPGRGTASARSAFRRPGARPPTAAAASSGSDASPSSSIAPISAPRSGPLARSQSIGGPAWQNWPRLKPDHVARPAARPRAAPPAASIRAQAVALAAVRRGSARTRDQVVLGARVRRTPVHSR